MNRLKVIQASQTFVSTVTLLTGLIATGLWIRYTIVSTLPALHSAFVASLVGVCLLYIAAGITRLVEVVD